MDRYTTNDTYKHELEDMLLNRLHRKKLYINYKEYINLTYGLPRDVKDNLDLTTHTDLILYSKESNTLLSIDLKVYDPNKPNKLYLSLYRETKRNGLYSLEYKQEYKETLINTLKSIYTNLPTPNCVTHQKWLIHEDNIYILNEDTFNNFYKRYPTPYSLNRIEQDNIQYVTLINKEFDVDLELTVSSLFKATIPEEDLSQVMDTLDRIWRSII